MEVKIIKSLEIKNLIEEQKKEIVVFNGSKILI